MLETTFDTDEDADDEIAGVSGAGVVPVCVSPVTGTVYVLLGREKYHNNWSSSLKWSGFEGSNNGHETCIENSARELFEETGGVLFEKEKIMNDLQSGNFLAKISVRSFKNKKRHVTFLKLVPYDPTYPIRFGAAVFALSELAKLGEKLKSSSSSEDGEWVSQKSKRSMSSSKIKKEMSMILEENSSLLDGHPALNIQRDEAGQILSLTVAEEFIEKSQVRLWKIDELKDAVREGHGYSNFIVRPLFCVVARVICETLPSIGRA